MVEQSNNLHVVQEQFLISRKSSCDSSLTKTKLTILEMPNVRDWLCDKGKREIPVEVMAKTRDFADFLKNELVLNSKQSWIQTGEVWSPIIWIIFFYEDDQSLKETKIKDAGLSPLWYQDRIIETSY